MFFFEVLAESSYGHKLKSTPDGDCQVVAGPEWRYALYSLDVSRGAVPSRLEGLVVEHLLAVTEKDLWVVTDTHDIWRISKSGLKSEKIMPLPKDWVPSLIHLKFSPDGTRVAMSAVPREHFFHKRDLLVIDAVSGKTLFEQKLIFVESDLLSNSTPELYFSWLNNETLQFIEAIVTKTSGPDKREGFEQSVDVNVASGKRTREEKTTDYILPSYGGAENESKREPEGRHTVGLFEREGRKLFFAGQKEPVLDLDDRSRATFTELEISPGGEWAAYYSQSNAVKKEENGEPPFLGPYLLNGKTREKQVLIEGWIYDMKWMPAIETKAAQ